MKNIPVLIEKDGITCEIFKGKLLCSIGNRYLVYNRGHLEIKEQLDGKCIHRISLPGNPIINTFAKIRFIERALRYEPRTAVDVNENEAIISYHGAIYRINAKNGSLYKEHDFRPGMHNALSFCRADSKILYGEYWPNTDRDEVSIFERDSASKWRKVYSFQSHTIKHIHQIVFDKDKDCYWISTGDADNESGIWRADLNFDNVHPYIHGNQISRSCFVVPQEFGIFMATDTPIENNKLYYVDHSSKIKTDLFELAGSCIYGIQMDNDKFALSTAVECNPDYPMLKSLLKNELAKGIKDRYARIIIYFPKQGCFELARALKDNWGIGLFGFGTFQFPIVNENGFLYCTGSSLKKLDGKTIKFDITELIQQEIKL